MLHVVIMSGGSGTRFWPRSRRSRPKQLLPLLEGASLLQRTAERIAPLAPPERRLVVTNASQAAATRAQLAGLVPEGRVIAEPEGRDTAPCIGLAAALIARDDPEGVMVVLPADHLIEPAARFCELIESAAAEASPGRVITLGVKPTYPATGFGYIERGAALGEGPLRAVESFKEKPDLATAEAYLASGRFLWNGGIFVWRAATILDELRRHEPEMAAGLARIVEAWDGPERDAVLAAEYPRLRKVSIDYAVLERCDRIAVLELDTDWNDLGSWTAVEALHTPDAEGHRVLDSEHISVASRGCFVVGDGRAIATVGVEDLIIVQTEDATLICKRGEEQRVKEVVEALKARGRRELVDE